MRLVLMLLLGLGATSAWAVPEASPRRARAEGRAPAPPGDPTTVVPQGYPEGADVETLTRDGSAVGPLGKRRVQGKYTVFDVFADWCSPCRIVDAYLKWVLSRRSDVAVRRLNLVGFETPLADELKIDALPFVIVFTPAGKRIHIEGADLPKLEKALARP